MKKKFLIITNILKGKEGITLISLVISIIMMLILAGIAISIIAGEKGLFEKTRLASELYEESSQQEANEIKQWMDILNAKQIEEVAKLGDFVDYSVEVDSNGNGVIDEGEIYDKWRILNYDNNGHIELVCYNGPTLTLEGKDDFCNVIKILNTKSQPYASGLYGESARHLGSNPDNFNSYETIDPNYAVSPISEDNREYLSQTHHEADVKSITSFSTSDTLKDDVWLASRKIDTYPTHTCFFIRLLSSYGYEGSNYIYIDFNDGGDSSHPYTYSLAPVVSLEKGVKIVEGSGNGEIDNPWKLIK